MDFPGNVRIYDIKSEVPKLKKRGSGHLDVDLQPENENCFGMENYNNSCTNNDFYSTSCSVYSNDLARLNPSLVSIPTSAWPKSRRHTVREEPRQGFRPQVFSDAVGNDRRPAHRAKQRKSMIVLSNNETTISGGEYDVEEFAKGFSDLHNGFPPNEFQVFTDNFNPCMAFDNNAQAVFPNLTSSYAQDFNHFFPPQNQFQFRDGILNPGAMSGCNIRMKVEEEHPDLFKRSTQGFNGFLQPHDTFNRAYDNPSAFMPKPEPNENNVVLAHWDYFGNSPPLEISNYPRLDTFESSEKCVDDNSESSMSDNSLTVSTSNKDAVSSDKFNKGPWSAEEDQLLLQCEKWAREKNWTRVAQLVPYRSAKQCRERWCYNLDPEISRKPWTVEEDIALIRLQKKYGNKWAKLSQQPELGNRTENAVKTRFKSIERAKRKEWEQVEDLEIINLTARYGVKWEKIAEAFNEKMKLRGEMSKGRTKHAVKVRCKLLQKGLEFEPKPESNNAAATVRELYYPSSDRARLSAEYKEKLSSRILFKEQDESLSVEEDVLTSLLD